MSKGCRKVLFTVTGKLNDNSPLVVEVSIERNGTNRPLTLSLALSFYNVKH